jgi:site-specific recombinase XerC
MTSTRVVQEMLGHANIRQTMDVYSHVLPNMQQQAAELMDAMSLRIHRCRCSIWRVWLSVWRVCLK